MFTFLGEFQNGRKVSSKSDQKQKIFITRTFFVNKQLTFFLIISITPRSILLKISENLLAIILNFTQKCKQTAVSQKLSKIKKNFKIFLHLLRCLNFWDNKNFWGAESGSLTHASAVNRKSIYHALKSIFSFKIPFSEIMEVYWVYTNKYRLWMNNDEAIWLVKLMNCVHWKEIYVCTSMYIVQGSG